MIVAIEGPDLSGKTTLFKALQPLLKAAYIDVPRFTKKIMRSFATQHDDLYMALFTQMYDPSKLYIVDRFPPITSQVYDRLHGREVRPLYNESLMIVYVDISLDILLTRLSMRGDELVTESLLRRYKMMYDYLMTRLPCYRVTTQTPQEVADAIQAEHDRRVSTTRHG